MKKQLDIEAYAALHSKVVSPELLAELERRTHLQTTQPQMLSGLVQGQFLATISRMLKPKRILEIGTFTGFSALCLAQGLTEGGELHTLEINPELAELARTFWAKAGLSEKIFLHLGNALDLLSSIDGHFDLVFIDADKAAYPLYYEQALARLNPGGYIVLDNMWWHGRLWDEKDKRSKVLRELNEQIQADSRVNNLFLPLRDGLMLVEKKPEL